MKLFNPNFVNPLFAALGLLFVAWLLASSVEAGPSEGCNPGRYVIDDVDSFYETKGIVFKFRSWPAAKEEMSLVQEMKMQGLEKTEVLSFTKVWVFEWAEEKVRGIISTHMISIHMICRICKRLKKKTDSLEYCVSLVSPVHR